MAKNSLCLVFNAHLPFVKHPEYPTFFEEDWFFEALTESYLPLLSVFNRLKKDGVPFKLVISMSSPLVTMLKDDILIERYIGHLNKMIDLTKKELKRTENTPFASLAKMYNEKYTNAYDQFVNIYKKDVITVLKSYVASNNLELVTTTATHAFLPLYEAYPEIVEAQVRVALDNHIDNFGKLSEGFWLSDLGYYPGLDKILKKYGVKYFFASANGVLLGEKNPKDGVYSSFKTPNGLSFFCRDVITTDEVLSTETGYPSNNVYRDFNRDIGFDLDFDYIKDFILDKKIRIHTGIKYYAITGKDEKKIYNPKKGIEQAKLDAKDFVQRREVELKNISKKIGKKAIIVAPFDNQMFGHFWFEGPVWIEHIFREAADSKVFEFTTTSEYLKQSEKVETIEPIFSSCATGGFSQQFLTGSNDWIYSYIFTMIEKIKELALRYSDEKNLKERLLNQALRELLLVQSSDWPFLMQLSTNSSYVIDRVKGHIENFDRICNYLIEGEIDAEWFLNLEKKNSIFPNIDYKKLLDVSNK